jgi:hypothetical protein
MTPERVEAILGGTMGYKAIVPDLSRRLCTAAPSDVVGSERERNRNRLILPRLR